MGKQVVHEKLGINYEMPELRQRDLEAFQPAYFEEKAKTPGAYGEAGATVRVAARMGWLAGLKEDAVADMAPNAVLYLAVQIHKHISEAISIPPF